MHDGTMEDSESEGNAAWARIRQELIGKEFYDFRTGGRHAIATVEAVHGRYLIGRCYLVRDTGGRLCEIAPVPLDSYGGTPYAVVVPNAAHAASPYEIG